MRVRDFVLLASFLFGVAHLAFLPVWEGFDEFAHYASVQQIADTGTIPTYGQAHISTDAESYPGPRAYASGAGPDFSPPGHASYRAFAQTGAALPDHVARQFQPTAELNWQAQHPPLFYALLAPVYLATKTWGWVDHLFVLRLAAWAFAFAGIAIGARAARDEKTALVIAAYPLLLPQFVPEMARLGNDSLCLLLTSAAWVLTLQMLKERGGIRRPLLLAGVLGLGLLTKAFFLPLTAGVVALLGFDWWKAREKESLRDIAIVAAGAGAIGLWWYVRNYLTLGSFSGANDFIRTAEGFDLLRGLRENLSFGRLVQGLAQVVVTYLAAGGWSLVIPPVMLLIAAALLPATTLGGWATKVIKTGEPVEWAPVFFVAPILAGLLWHLLHNLALPVKFAGTPGWYLHIAAVPIAVAMARGWRWPRVCGALAALAFAATLALELLQLSLYSGCSTKAAMGKSYDFAGSSCFIDMRALDNIATPWLGVLAAVLAAGCLGAAFRRRPALSVSPSGAPRSDS